MKTLRKASLTLTCVAMALFGGNALADAVSPVSYTFDQPTTCGTWCYPDAAYTKLTDGVLGRAGWAANSGAEWAGWAYQPVVNIDFNFGSARLIDIVRVGSTQDNLGDVVLPSISIFSSNDNAVWTLVKSLVVPPVAANDKDLNDTAAHGFLTLTGLGINAQYVRVGALANGPWTFVDEVQFDSGRSSAIPEPAALSLLGLGLAGLAMARRRA